MQTVLVVCQFLKQTVYHSSIVKLGPDSRRCLEAVIKNDSTEAEPSDGGLMLWFFASELLLRGDMMVVQPHHDEELENLFCWNGEVCMLYLLFYHFGVTDFPCLRQVFEGLDVSLCFPSVCGIG